ncbi:MAG: phosphate signaling complex protein PhoU [Phycisphaeraceae bacterium]
MPLHLQRQIEQLKKMILTLGGQVEDAVQKAIRAVQTRDVDLAREVIRSDTDIDMGEVQIEEECLHALALDQPVAFQLRYVIAVLKINNELERIADLAVNIAEQGLALAEEAHIETVPYDLEGMTRHVREMLTGSLDALVNIDPAQAERVRGADDHVDVIHRDMYQSIERAIRADVAHVEQFIHLLSVSRNLERIADHCVNIAEDVIYMAEGDIRRHSRPHPLAEEAESGEMDGGSA